MCMPVKVVNQLKPIGEMETFKKSNCNLCSEERLTTVKINVTNASWLWKKIGDIQGLPKKNDLPYISPKH